MGPADTPSPDTLRALAHSYYTWRDSSYPVTASDQGLHTRDDRLTDYRPASVASRGRHGRELLARVKAMPTVAGARMTGSTGTSFGRSSRAPISLPG